MTNAVQSVAGTEAHGEGNPMAADQQAADVLSPTFNRAKTQVID